MSRFDEPIDLVPIDDPVGEAWAEYVYHDDPQPLIPPEILLDSGETEIRVRKKGVLRR